MSLTFFVFLSSGLLLGWSLGANDAGNVFGTAVGSRILRFSTAAAVRERPTASASWAP